MTTVLAVCSCGDATQPLQRLFACTHCGELRCPRCVQDEIVSFFCPACLKDVPSSTIKTGRNRCMNNCFKCPVCASITATVSSADETQHYLACNVCRWNSLASGLTESSPAAFSETVRQKEIPPAARSAFDDLQQKLALLVPPLTAGAKPIALGPRKPELTPKELGIVAVHGDLKTSEIECDVISDQKAPTPTDVPIVSMTTEAQPAIPITELSTLVQRFRWPAGQAEKQNELLPERVPLTIKRSRRCRVCNYNLIKLEAKPQQQIKFSIHLCAVFFLPNLSVTRIIPEPASESTRVQMKLVNPLEMDVIVSLSSSPMRSSPGVEITSEPIVDALIGAYNELGEYDDDKSTKAVAGVLEKKANYVVIEFVVLHAATTGLTGNVGLALSFEYKGATMLNQVLVQTQELILRFPATENVAS